MVGVSIAGMEDWLAGEEVLALAVLADIAGYSVVFGCAVLIRLVEVALRLVAERCKDGDETEYLCVFARWRGL